MNLFFQVFGAQWNNLPKEKGNYEKYRNNKEHIPRYKQVRSLLTPTL